MFLKILPAALTIGLTLTACAPKDQKLARPDGRVTTRNLTNDTALKQMAAVMDKQIEGLHLLKALVDSDYATGNGLDVKTLSESDTVIYKKITSAKDKEKQVVDETYGLRRKINLFATINLENEVIKSVEIVGAGAMGNRDDLVKVSDMADEKKSELSVVSKLKTITLKEFVNKETKKVDFYFLDTESYDETNSKAAGKNVATVKTSSKLIWDGSTAKLGAGNKLEVTRLEVKPEGESPVYMTNKNSVTVDIKDCVSINGGMVLAYKPPTTFAVEYKDSSAFVNGSSLGPQAVKCDSRPGVDLRKLL